MYKQISKYQWSLLIAGVFILLIASFDVEAKEKNNKLETYDYVKPFLWGESIYGRPGYYDFSIVSDSTRLHPLGLGMYAFYTLWKGSENNDPELHKLGRKYIDFLADEYPLIRRNENTELYIYPLDNQDLKGGNWHSGMANSIIALSFLQAHQIFNEPSYLMHAEQAMRGVTEDISEGGSALKIKDGKWFLEYAAQTIDPTNGRFVLNGFLYQLLALKLYGDITQDDYFLSQYESGLNAFREICDQYHYMSGDWTFYGLNPKIAEPTHYMIFDIILFDALYELSNESLFNVESSFRRNILKEHYNLESRPLNKGQDTYLFSQVGPPNPYWVDMYSSTIRFRSEDDTEEIHLENPRDFEIPIESRCFSMDTLVKEKYKSVEVWAKYFSDSVLLFESRIEDINYAIEPDVLPEYDLTTSYLAERESSSRSVIQNPASGQDLNRGMISVQFDQVFDGSQDKYLGLVINCEKRFRSLRLFLTNTFNEKASRYYINTLVPGKDNLILISIAGLKNIDQLTNTDFSSIQLHFYNSPPEEDSPYSVDIKDVVFFRSNYNLKRFLEKKPDLVFKEKEIGGFLY